MEESTVTKPIEAKPENAFISILCNIVIPVVVLQQLTKYFGSAGPLIALFVALAFPLSYGLWDYFANHRRNWISILGIVNTLLTGGLTLIATEALWFYIKEAAFPSLIGIFVLFSAFSASPFFKTLVLNPQVTRIDLIEEQIKKNNCEQDFTTLLKFATIFLAFSFFLSAAINLFLSFEIFTDINPALSSSERVRILNDQIAKMHWRSFVVILLPSMLSLLAILWYFLSGLKKMTGLSIEEVFKER